MLPNITVLDCFCCCTEQLVFRDLLSLNSLSWWRSNFYTDGSEEERTETQSSGSSTDDESGADVPTGKYHLRKTKPTVDRFQANVGKYSLYFSNYMYNMVYRSPRMKTNNHLARRLEIDKHPDRFNCDGYMLSKVWLRHIPWIICLDDVATSHWIPSHFTPHPHCKICVSLHFLLPPSYSAWRCWNTGMIWAYNGAKLQKLKFITLAADRENRRITIVWRKLYLVFMSCILNVCWVELYIVS